MPAAYTIDDAVDRIWHAALLIMWQDFRRIEERKRGSSSEVAAPIGHENSPYARGMIYAFFDGWREMSLYTPTRYPVQDDQGFINIFAGGIVRRLSNHLDHDSDLARVIARGEDGSFYIAAKANLKRLDDVARERLKDTLTDINDAEPAFASLFGDPDAALIYSPQKVYGALLCDAYHGFEATRTEAALFLAVATGNPVIMARQRVCEQEYFDVPRTAPDPVSGAKREIIYSRLGTGDLLQFGSKGLLRKVQLRVRPDAQQSYHVGSVLDAEGKVLPVAFELTEYRFDEAQRKVVRAYDPPGLISNDLFRDFWFKG
ncbi:MAG: hypothetical protein ABIH41_04315 [Nanoarchaeota archaeon]